MGTLALVAGVAAPAAASTGTSDAAALAELTRLNPGMTTSQMQAEITRAATAARVTPHTMLTKVLAESKSASQTSRLASVPSGGTVRLGVARQMGDIFFQPASTALIPHGHTGIFSTQYYAVEAPGQGQRVANNRVYTRLVKRGASKMWVNGAALAQRKAAVAFAKSKLNYGYNSNFAFNRRVTAGSYNCSQLVWASYKRAMNLDLDSNGGFGVYPTNIRDSRSTHIYQTV